MGAIFSAYEQNQMRAQKNFKGNRGILEGVVNTVDLDMFDKVQLSIGSGKQFEIQSLLCSPKNPEAAESLNKGQQVQIVATIGEEVMGTPTLKDCWIVTPEI